AYIQPLFFACCTLWLALTGALGSAAFIYVNALPIQVDPRLDLTSRTFITMRLVLGALFALPFEGGTLKHFVGSFSTSDDAMDIKPSMLLLLPFVLGFSTSLALHILSQFVDGAATFFGLGKLSRSAGQGATEGRTRTRGHGCEWEGGPFSRLGV